MDIGLVLVKFYSINMDLLIIVVIMFLIATTIETILICVLLFDLAVFLCMIIYDYAQTTKIFKKKRKISRNI